MKFLGPNDDFPPVETANEVGLVAFGGDLSTKRLIRAYSSGIFPWYDISQPILWWSPDPRMVLFPEKLKISKSMKHLLKKGIFEVTFNSAFEEIIKNCASIKRRDQLGTWLSSDMQQAYIKLHHEGFARSVEVWKDGVLVAGAYGIWIEEKKLFCGESMFTKVSNASKFGFIHLVQQLREENVKLIDCQIYTEHLASLGAEEIPRSEFLKFLR